MALFEITIQRGPAGRWPVVVEHVSDDSAPVRTDHRLNLDWPSFEQELTKTADCPAEYGRLLGEEIFRGYVDRTFSAALASATHAEPLHVLLFVEADDLSGLRWERLCAPLETRWDFLSLDQRVTFCLYLPSGRRWRFMSASRLDLRALLVVASPEGLDKYKLTWFDPAATVAGVRAALGDIPCQVLSTAPGADGPPTLEALCEWVTAERFAILHIVCHGRFFPDKDKTKSDTTLYLTNDDGSAAPVSGKALVARLSRLGGLPPLVFLSACETAVAETGGAFGGLAQQLVRDLGVPAVVGMTEPITVQTAGELAGPFYRHLRRHGEVARALGEACAGLAGRHDIHVPALYSRVAGRPLFSDAPTRPPTDADITRGLARAREFLNERAPIILPEFERHAAVVTRFLGTDPALLAPPAKQERQAALDRVNDVCEEALEVSFQALGFGQAVPPYDTRRPFRGLYPFRTEDREFFFGREDLVARLRDRLARHRFLAVLGSSGCGKSSLVLAGLAPALCAEEPGLVPVVLVPGTDPAGRLDAILAGKDSALVIVDQFEEVFTLCRREDERLAFFARLLELSSRSRVVVTMRADFWGECAPYRDLKERMLAGQELVAPMDAGELRRAIEGQAGAVRLRFETDLSATILDDVQGEPGAMPLLQHALLLLWERRHGRWLKTEEYRATGGVKQAIARSADAFYDRQSAADRELIRDIFLRLTRLDDEAAANDERRSTRQRVDLEELVPTHATADTIRGLVTKLANERLLITGSDPQNGRQVVEVAHEALIRSWPTLRGWLKEDVDAQLVRQALRGAAREWDGNRQDAGYLVHRGDRLAGLERMVSRNRVRPNRVERAYFDACVSFAQLEGIRAAEDQKRDLAEVGWGVIFAHDADPAVREALSKLLEHRRRIATRKSERFYREFTGVAGYRLGETKLQFSLRHGGAGSGIVDPQRMPYYLLIVGSPELIPFEFQYALDVQYAVGRIHFDTIEEYQRYANSVVKSETTQGMPTNKVVVFGTNNPGSQATDASYNRLIVPLANYLMEQHPEWDTRLVHSAEATKVRLRQILSASQTPSLLFTAGHGMSFPCNDPRQEMTQGALVCQDWPGSQMWKGPFPSEFYFSATDLGEDSRLDGMIAFLCSCYSAGTPAFSNSKDQIAPHAFLAKLSQRMLRECPESSKSSTF